jgi:hypothetical protein
MKYSPDYTRFLAPVQKTNSAPHHNVHHREPTSYQPTRPKLCPRDNLIQSHNTHDHNSNAHASNPPTQRGQHTLAHSNQGNHLTQTIHNTNNHTTNTNNAQQQITPIIQIPTTTTTTTTTVILHNNMRTYNLHQTPRTHTHLSSNTHQLALLHHLGPQCNHLPSRQSA